jgi:hypothetical protein
MDCDICSVASSTIVGLPQILDHPLKQSSQPVYRDTLMRRDRLPSAKCATGFWREESSFSVFRIRPCGLFHIIINLELWILETVGRNPSTGDQPCRKAATYTGLHKHRKTRTDIHYSNGIRAHDPSVQAREDISYFRPRGLKRRIIV